MAFDWQDFLQVAEFCHKCETATPSREALCRTAVGRAYYAAFCSARDYATSKMSYTPTGNGDDHTLVRAHYRQAGKRDVHKLLLQLYNWRCLCDYESGGKVAFDEMAKFAISNARLTISALSVSPRW